MVAIFFGLTASNLLLLSIVFVLGLFAVGPQGHPGDLYPYHLGLGIAAGLLGTLTHLSIYTYFMATTRWLAAAADKAGLAIAEFVVPAEAAKRRSLTLVMTAIIVLMLTMFAGAGADPTRGALWPPEVHLAMAAFTIVLHAGIALAEYRLIRAQGGRMDRALDLVNRAPRLSVEG